MCACTTLLAHLQPATRTTSPRATRNSKLGSMAPAGPLYSALEMAGAALACKNAALDELTLRLAALQRPAGLPAACGEGDEGEAAPPAAQSTAGDSTQQPAAELAAVRQRLAAAEGLLAAERSQRLAVKSQLEAVKRQLGEAVAAQVGAGLGGGGHGGPPSGLEPQPAQTCTRRSSSSSTPIMLCCPPACWAQGHAASELGELEGLIQELRAENQQASTCLLLHEGIDGAPSRAGEAHIRDAGRCLPLLAAQLHHPPFRGMQLQATLTQRESAYLTLLETVQQLFVEHSPMGSGGGSSPAKLAGERAQQGIPDMQHKAELVDHQGMRLVVATAGPAVAWLACSAWCPSHTPTMLPCAPPRPCTQSAQRESSMTATWVLACSTSCGNGSGWSVRHTCGQPSGAASSAMQ